ncbi:MAG: ATP-binding protein [Acidobacteria bacterium]|nr:ATP-binding protein [Acidobacteriota bacterium]
MTHGTSQKPSLRAVERSKTPEDPSQCPRCFGTGIELTADGAKRCFCRVVRDDADQSKRAKLPRRYDNCHFSNYKPQNPSQTAALRYATTFTMEYPAVDRGLIFMGTVGVGKTHLAVSILKGLAERGFSCLFYEFGALLKEIQDSYNPNTFTSELSVLAPVLNTEVLVLDELGASKPTDWVRDTLGHIINTRYNDKKLTVFTTNYLDSRPNEREETLEDRIGVRTRSRLFEMCKSVEITGPDYRRGIDSKQ